jgi:hypothetical protein
MLSKNRKLLAYWLFSTALVVFGAITAYIAMWARPAGATMWTVVKAGFPIWGTTILAAAIIFAGYHYYTKQQE